MSPQQAQQQHARGPCGTQTVPSTMEKMPYEYKDHHLVLLEELKTMLDDRLLIDVYICVGQSEIPCHRNVLSAASPYFRAMFTSDMSESKQLKVKLHEVDAASVAALVDFAYTGKVCGVGFTLWDERERESVCMRMCVCVPVCACMHACVCV